MKRLFHALPRNILIPKLLILKSSTVSLSGSQSSNLYKMFGNVSIVFGCSLVVLYTLKSTVYNIDQEDEGVGQGERVQARLESKMLESSQNKIEEGEAREEKEVAEEMQEVKESNQISQQVQHQKQEQQGQKGQQGQQGQQDTNIKYKRIVIPEPNTAIITKNCPKQVREYLLKCDIAIRELPQKYCEYHPDLVLTNRKNRHQTFSFKPSEQQHSSILTIPQLKSLTNFLNPPHQLHTNDQFTQMLSTLQKQYQFLIVTYIPPEQPTKLNEYDTYTQEKMPDFRRLQELFDQQKINSGTNQANYCIVRNYELAKQMKIANHKGDIHIIYKTTPNSGMQTSTLINNQKYTYKKIFNAPSSHTPDIHYPKRLDFFTNIYLNEINIEQDIQNFIEKHQRIGDSRKILVVSAREKREEFRSRIKEILRKVGKIMRNELLVVYTDNEKVLTKYFKIVPEDFATIRLCDLNTLQSPLLIFPEYNTQRYSSHTNSLFSNKFYSRRKFIGAFTVENICKFVENSDQIEEHYEQKSNLTSLGSIVSLSRENLDHKVVLHWKHGCQGCKLTAQYLQKIKQITQLLDQPHSKQQIYKYNIENPELLKNIQYVQYNILNQQEDQQNSSDHDLTPQLMYHETLENNKIVRNINIGEIIGGISKIDPQNQEEVHQGIIRKLISGITSARLQILKQINNDVIESDF